MKPLPDFVEHEHAAETRYRAGLTLFGLFLLLLAAALTLKCCRDWDAFPIHSATEALQ